MPAQTQAYLVGRLPTPFELQAVVESALDDVAAEALVVLRSIVSGWATPVVFTLRKALGTRAIECDSDIFSYVDLGTKPHIIRAKRAPQLVFMLGGSPRTRPNVLSSGSGTPGTTRVSAKEVHHPGNEARNFTLILQRELDVKLERLVEVRTQSLIDRLANP